jgi:hypothetical protein
MSYNYNNRRRYEPRYSSSSALAPVGRHASSGGWREPRARVEYARDSRAAGNNISSSYSSYPAVDSSTRRSPHLSRDFDRVARSVLRALGSRHDPNQEAAVLKTVTRMDTSDKTDEDPDAWWKTRVDCEENWP